MFRQTLQIHFPLTEMIFADERAFLDFNMAQLTQGIICNQMSHKNFMSDINKSVLFYWSLDLKVIAVFSCPIQSFTLFKPQEEE